MHINETLQNLKLYPKTLCHKERTPMANVFARIRKATPQECLNFVGVSGCAKAGLNFEHQGHKSHDYRRNTQL